MPNIVVLDAQDVGEKLHGQIARGHAAVDSQHDIGILRPVGTYRIQQVAGLVADRFQRGPGNLRRARVPGEPEDGAARLRVPIGRA